MKFILFAAILTAPPAHAGVVSWFISFCEQQFIADDPYPLAKDATEDLLHALSQIQGRVGTPVLDELIYRYRSGWNMTPKQRARFRDILGVK